MRIALNRINNYALQKLSPQSTRSYSVKLAEVGRFESRQPDEECYPAGQPFLHRIFGYRGVILFPWLAQIYDVDLKKQSDPANDLSRESLEHDRAPENQNEGSVSESNRAKSQATIFHPYYQVLIDTRDFPYVSNRTQIEAVTFLARPNNSKSVYSIKGLDYVAHEDILPYTSYEEQPIHHGLHKKLFNYNSTDILKFTPSDLLDDWRSKHPWLKLSRVYRETTENVRITVIPFYLGCTLIQDMRIYWWRYCVRLENFSDVSVQLRERHWSIYSQTNMKQTIKGRGVVGVEPLLSKNEPAYQYSSHVNLQDGKGQMKGTFKMQREDGYTFECKIPTFFLESSIEST